MALGGHSPEWDEYEWFPCSPARLTLSRPRSSRVGTGTAAAGPAQSLAEALEAWLREDPTWADRRGERLLLVDLDNLRAGRLRWQGRIAAMTGLAEHFDHVVLAGQHDAVRRARPHLGDIARAAQGVADGSDLADHVLLDAAMALDAPDAHVVVVSNDGIFAQLAERWPVTVLSPDFQALSERLRDAAVRTVDLAALERAAATARRRARRS